MDKNVPLRAEAETEWMPHEGFNVDFACLLVDKQAQVVSL